MDKNNIIGFSLIAAVLIGFSIWNQPSAEERAEIARQDSIANVKKEQKNEQRLHDKILLLTLRKHRKRILLVKLL